MPAVRTLLARFARREVVTVARTPALWVLAAALGVVAVGVAWTSEGATAGYLPVVVDLLTPVELLVPVVSFAFGYRALVDDRGRGELEVLSTFPSRPRTVVAGVFAGRAAAVAVAVAVALAPVLALVWAADADAALAASHGGADSPLLFLRFAALSTLYALVALALSLAASARSRGTRGVIAVLAATWLALGFGADLGLLVAVDQGLVGDDALRLLLALSPAGAYRGLVLRTVVNAAAATTVDAAAPLASLLSLLGWLVGSLAVAAEGLWERG